MYRVGQEEIDACRRVIESGEFFKINSGAMEVIHFEEELKEKFGTPYAVCMTSGKAALISALVGMGIGPGDEVIVPAYTYIATAMAVTAVGAIPVIAECDETLTLDPDDFESKITPETKAVIPVHIQGLPCNMDRIMAIARAHGILVLEDACQADGGSYHGKRLGTIGDAGAYSFNCFKTITSGEGGAMVTNDRKIYERGFIYHDASAVAFFGNQLKNVEEEQFCGTEYRVSELTGAILREQLKKLDPILADLRRNHEYLLRRLGSRYRFVKSNDPDGDCATRIIFWFDTPEEALAFKAKSDAAGYYAIRPIDTGRHVYSNWTPILRERGAFHPAFDPFKMEANKNLRHHYTPDMCPKSLSYLARAVYLGVDPNADEERLENMIRPLLA